MTKKRDFLTLVTNLALVLLNSVKRIPTWQTLLKLGWRIFSITLWAILILIVLSSFGRHFAFGNTLAAPVANTTGVASKFTIAATQTDKLTVELDAALVAARKAALTAASDELDTWINGLMSRVDSSQDVDFLDWYFGYWTQKKFGLDGTLQTGKRVLSKNSPTAKEKIQKEVLEEFTNRVLQPELAKLELKTISRDISQIYTSELQRNFEKIRIKYNIPKVDWNEYLQGVTVLVTNVEGKQVPLQLKAFTIGSLGSGALLTKATVVLFEKMTGKIATKALVSTSFLGKTGGLVGGEFLGPLATMAIIAWDVVDVHNTEVKYRPILKQNIEGYFSLMKKDILNNEQSGIQKVILDIEKSVRKGMSGSRLPSLNWG
ncbi:hypothetical protein [Mastigocoleus testarum]|uniref:Uncharacterized protein n=1 Tax=Mastigocoleus testarum BC008 TaxID=371196 RepID=A0A0V7ZPJ7_9CYAN|nr:hypothetical protein [Mastigocoleus testarum]KST66362.1 hypothetical protein BC008_25670 [Mastigocoleus testarum BC008]KST66683.1 hypothetical protein BC008_26195 [Mastigocoleus testarum BC008]